MCRAHVREADKHNSSLQYIPVWKKDRVSKANVTVSEVEIRFLICQDKMSRQFEFWLDISRIWLDKFSEPIMIIIIMKGTKVLTFSASMDSKFNWIGNAIDFLSQSVFRLIAHARAVWLKLASSCKSFVS